MNHTYRYTYSRGSSTAIWVISGIVAVVLLIAAGKTLKKAGHNPWKILIPIYGGYLLYKIADAEGFFGGRWLCPPYLPLSPVLLQAAL